MGAFLHELDIRIAAVRRGLDDASQAGDHYLVDVHLGELESLVRLAAEHDVRIEAIEQTFADHGRTAPRVPLIPG